MVLFGVAVSMDMRGSDVHLGMMLSAVVLGISLLVWLGLMVNTAKSFRHPMQGPLLALLAHAIFAGYLGGTIFFVWGLVAVAVGGWAQGIIIIFGLTTAIIACRFGEKFIARCCIREYLRRQSQAD